jgi:predicted GNAT family acetyltransferase
MIEIQEVTYKADLNGIDWTALTARLKADDFDNGRTPDQLRLSFENSFTYCFAWADDEIVGKVRCLSDGVCNAYIVDVWTYTPYRNRGVARHMMETVMEKLPGQHVYLFTDDSMDFYRKLGFTEQGVGMSRIVGQWLVNR